MLIPPQFLLNLKTSAGLVAERDAWEKNLSVASGSDVQKINEYLVAIDAELKQRGENSRLANIVSAPLDLLGLNVTSGGGAQSAVGGVADATGEAFTGLTSGVKTALYIVGGIAVFGIGAFIYANMPKGGTQ